MPHDFSADARELLAAFEQIKTQEPLPPYDEEAFSDPNIRSRVGAVIARAVDEGSSMRR